MFFGGQDFPTATDSPPGCQGSQRALRNDIFPLLCTHTIRPFWNIHQEGETNWLAFIQVVMMMMMVVVVVVMVVVVKVMMMNERRSSTSSCFRNSHLSKNLMFDHLSIQLYGQHYHPSSNRFLDQGTQNATVVSGLDDAGKVSNLSLLYVDVSKGNFGAMKLGAKSYLANPAIDQVDFPSPTIGTCGMNLPLLAISWKLCESIVR